MTALYILISQIIGIVIFLVIAQAVLSLLVGFGIVNPHQQLVQTIGRMLDAITAPIYKPIRSILPNFGGFDFSPLVVILLLQFIDNLLYGLFREF